MLVEQNARQAVSIADKIIVLKNGEVAFDGPKEALDDSARRYLYRRLEANYKMAGPRSLNPTYGLEPTCYH